MENSDSPISTGNNPPQSPLTLRGDETAALPSKNKPANQPPLKVRGGTRESDKAGALLKSQYEQTLVAAGLEPDQAIVYETLLKTGPLKAGKLALKTPLKRGLVYKVLDELVDLGLVTKNEPTGKVATFEPAHPLKLKDVAEAKEAKIKTGLLALDGIMGQLASDYNFALNKPGIQFFQGVDGLKKIYDDIINTGENFYLIRSIYEPTYKDQMLPVVEQFVKRRVAKKIGVTMISPKDEFFIRPRPEDSKIYLKRTWVEKSQYNAPVEIDIYGNKIALLSFGKELMGIIIDSPQIAQALEQVFLLSQSGAKQPSAQNS